MKVYITGGNSRLSYYVNKYINGIRLGRKKTDSVDIVTNYEKTELKEILKDADIVVHLAGKVIGTYNDLMESNVFLTQRIVESIPKKAKIIFASSVSVYGKNIKNGDEKSDINPDTNYAKTKAMAEEIVKKHKNYVILRIGTLYGEKYKMYFKIFDLLKRGLMPIIGNNKVPFTYAYDVGKIFKNVMNKKGIYVVSSRGYPINYVIKLSAKFLRVNGPKIKIPTMCLRITSLINKFIKISDFFDEEIVLSLISDRTFNPKKAEKELDFNITPIEKGVKNMVNFYEKMV